MNGIKLTTRSKIQLTLLSVALVIVLAILDHRTAPEILFSIFYLLPVFVVSCYVGRAPGVAVALASAVACLLQTGTGSPLSYPWIHYWNALVLFGFYAITSLIVSTLKHACDEAEKSSGIDFLTGIYNLRGFRELAHREKLRAERYHRPLTLAYLDLDDFKQVNDRFGHATGDRVLVDLAHIMRDRLRDTDVVGRVGGDEFVILLPETDYDAATLVLNKIHKLITDLLRDNVQITFSLGAATFLTQPATVEDMVHHADVLMYAAKRSGKNRVVHELIGADVGESLNMMRSAAG